MSQHIIDFLRSMDEFEMALEVTSMHNRLDAFSEGLDRECIGVMKSTVEKQAAEIERLTKERDEAIANEGKVCGDCDGSGWLENAVEGRYPCTCMTEAEPYQVLQEQLAAMAETVQKMRAALLEVEGLISESAGIYGLHLNGDPSPWEELLEGGMFERLSTLHEAIALPDQSANVINRIKAQGMREAAELAQPADSYQDEWFNEKSVCARIRARAAELEGKW